MSRATQKKAEEVMYPFAAFNQLVADNAEKLFALQLQSFQDYAKLGMDNWKAGMAVRDVTSLQEYAGQQREVAQAFAARMVEDAKAYSEIGSTFVTDARKTVQDNFKQAA